MLAVRRGRYDLQASWLWNVTQRIDNPLVLDFNPQRPEFDPDRPVQWTLEERLYWENTFGFKIDFKLDNAHLDPTAHARFGLPERL